MVINCPQPAWLSAQTCWKIRGNKSKSERKVHDISQEAFVLHYSAQTSAQLICIKAQSFCFFISALLSLLLPTWCRHFYCCRLPTLPLASHRSAIISCSSPVHHLNSAPSFVASSSSHFFSSTTDAADIHILWLLSSFIEGKLLLSPAPSTRLSPLTRDQPKPFRLAQGLAFGSNLVLVAG